MSADPATIDPALAAAILGRVSDGCSLAEICAEDGMPARQEILSWLQTDEDFAERYDKAQRLSAEALADDLLAMSRGFNAETPGRPPTQSELNTRDRLRAAIRQWLMAKWNPEKYGTKPRAAADPPPKPRPYPDFDNMAPEHVAWYRAADKRVRRYRARCAAEAAAEPRQPTPRPFQILPAIANGAAMPMPRMPALPKHTEEQLEAIAHSAIAPTPARRDPLPPPPLPLPDSLTGGWARADPLPGPEWFTSSDPP